MSNQQWQKISEIKLGDMKAIYFQVDAKPGFYLLPIDIEPLDWDKKRQQVDGLVQVKYAKDRYMGAYAGGNTMRQGESVERLQYKDQKVTESETELEVITVLADERGYEIKHHLKWTKGEKSVVLWNEFENQSNKEVTLEMLSSFSLGGLTPFTEGDAYETLKLHRIRSVWSMEGRVETESIEDLQLEPSWGGHAIRAERFGQAGSMPVNRFFPFAAVEDTKNQVIWGAQIAHNASWQMEVYRKDDGLALSGGLADREFGHWMKKVEPRECFTTPAAIVSVSHKIAFDQFCQRLTEAGMKYFKQAPQCEQSLPVIFNEYCTTWGNPSDENIQGILEKIKGHGFSYFVIDCGWFKEEGIPWDIDMGDYQVSKELFPVGLEKTVAAIHEAGMQAGIWFEIDNVGERTRAYQMEDMLLHKDGAVLTTTMRRFWDMRQEKVQKHLKTLVNDMVNKYGITYIKMDYNDSIGIGCDGAESLGEGLRQNMEASAAFIRALKADVSDLILENCASGGHKLEPLMMSLCAMASFSDAHECEEIPVIAANLHRTILPCQSQIWAVIRETDSLKRIAYSVANTFLGRMCLSGDVTNLSEESWQLIDAGIAFYKKAAGIIKEGVTYFYGTRQNSYRHLKGWQGVVRILDKQALVVIHIFHTSPEEIEIALPLSQEIINIDTIYSHNQPKTWMEGNQLKISGLEEMQGVGILLSEI